MAVTERMDMNFLHSAELHSSLHLLFQKSLCYRDHPILWLRSIETLFVVPNVICQKLRNIDSAVAFWGFRWCNDIFTFQALIGLAKNEFMIRSMLEQHISIRVGKFESDRLSLEVRRLKDVLNGVKVPEEAVDLLLECRALMEQLLHIANAEKEEFYDR